MPRDNFTKPTLDALSKRVGFFCSNPACGKPTIGPNSQPDGVLSIGVGAHIAAASAGGPRYDASMTPAERSSIGNGIWLCASCSVMIDKDPKGFPKPLIVQWKLDAESKAANRLATGQIAASPRPYIEGDLIWSHGGRANRGFSSKNPTIIHEGVTYLDPGPKPIIFWELDWNYRFVLYNTSSVPAFNISVETIGDNHLDTFSKPERKNSLPAMDDMSLSAEFGSRIESDHEQADEILLEKIPDLMNGIKLEISYIGENRQVYKTIMSIKDGEIDNQFL